MAVRVLRSTEDARRWLLQGLWLQRVLTPTADALPRVLEWLHEIADSGEPTLPAGFVADLGHLAFGFDVAGAVPSPSIAQWTAGRIRSYEDIVLGKLYADGSFRRAGDALRQYPGRDRARGLAFVVERFRERAHAPGVLLNAAAVKTLRDQPSETVLSEAAALVSQDGFDSALLDLYGELVSAVRQTGDVLGPEDVFELEHGTALAPFSQRLALRQALQAAARLESAVPTQPPRRTTRHRDTPTHFFDEDAYPVGGFSSIATRGSIESLLHSQLAFMEKHDRPDLFDIKFLRDELLYYARDENELWRRRRTFVFAFYPDLVQARFKDAELPWQRLMVLIGFVLAAISRWTAWLGDEALSFDLVFMEENETALEPERELATLLLREAIANGTAIIVRMPEQRLMPWCMERCRRSVCHLLTMASRYRTVAIDGVETVAMRIDGLIPELADGTEMIALPSNGQAMDAWSAALEWLLAHWL